MKGLPLEPSTDDSRTLAREAWELVEEFLRDEANARTLGAAPGPDDSDALLDGKTLPDGAPFAEVLATLRACVRTSLNTASPGFLAYYTPGGLYSSAIADFISYSLNRYVTLRGASPDLVRIEDVTAGWLRVGLDMPEHTQVVFTTGATMSTAHALAFARAGHERPLHRPCVIYSTNAHASVAKCLTFLGLKDDSIEIPTTTGRMEVDSVANALEAAVARGMTPIAVVCTAGTIARGMVDPIPELVDLCHKRNLWLHVDGAYGAAFRLLPELRTKHLAGIERCDSVGLDAHKSLFLPYGTGCLMLHSRIAKQRPLAGKAHYLSQVETADDPADYALELTRDFRALRLWLPFALHGVSRIREALQEKLALAAELTELLRASPGIAEVQRELSVVTFRAKNDDTTTRMVSLVNQSASTFISAVEYDGFVWARLCVLSVRSHRPHVLQAFDAVGRALAQIV